MRRHPSTSLRRDLGHRADIQEIMDDHAIDDHTRKDYTIHNDTMNDHTTCCIAGGGPAGVMLGYVLARAGVEVLVLEKHQDFFRDFRGDTIHPSTLAIMY